MSSDKKVDPDYFQKVDPDCVTLLEGINKLNKLILTKSKKFTLAMPSYFHFGSTAGTAHFHL